MAEVSAPISGTLAKRYRAGVLRFATVAYPGYTIVFPYWSKRYRAGVLRFATVAYPGYTIVFPYWSKRYRAGV